VYGLLRQGLPALTGAGQPASARGVWTTVGTNVILLGVTSLLTDISAEMVSAVLPIYLLYQLHISALQLGVIDGLYNGASGLVRLAAAFTADGWERRKGVAASGYALSAVSRMGLLAAGASLPGIAAFVLVDRIGKGIRTAPRDALISLSVPKERLGLAFGVHRTFDTAGALLGPALVFVILTFAPTAFDAVFVPSFSISLIGLGVIVLFVQDRRTSVVRQGLIPIGSMLRLLHNARFRVLIIAASAVTLFTASDTFIYVALQRQGGVPMQLFPLLYAATATFYLLLALPAGRVADSLGRRRVYLAGQLVMLAIVVVLATSISGSWLLAVLPLLGSYYALTDGVLMAATSAELSEQLRTSGLALLATCTSLLSLASSVALGAVWTVAGQQAAFALFAVGLASAIALGAWTFRAHPHTV
jgi:MFS family permease